LRLAEMEGIEPPSRSRPVSAPWRQSSGLSERKQREPFGGKGGVCHHPNPTQTAERDPSALSF